MTDLLMVDARWWNVAGWTMVHFLWLGVAMGIAAAASSFVLRRMGPNVRYAAALSWLTALTALPLGIAGWLVANSPAPQAVSSDEGGAVEIAGSGEQGASNAEGVGVGRQGVVDFAAAPIELTRDDGSIVELSARDPAHWGRPDAGKSGANRTASAATPPTPGTVPVESSAQSTGGASDARAFSVVESCVPYLPWVWLVGTPLTFALLATGLVGTRRLRSASRAIEAGPLVDMCARLSKSLRISSRVAVAVCERIAAPVLVGIVRPMILLPPSALMGWSPDEVEMVLLHELAHVRRWDNLVNLVQRLIESLLFFHPAVWLVSSWVRREREACCDAIVVGHTHEPQAYAEMLVAFAARVPRRALFSPAAASAMAAGPLRSRIRQILKLEDDPMLVSGKSLAIVTIVLLVIVPLSVMNLPIGGRAELTAPQDNAENAAEIAPQPKTTENADIDLTGSPVAQNESTQTEAISPSTAPSEYTVATLGQVGQYAGDPLSPQTESNSEVVQAFSADTPVSEVLKALESAKSRGFTDIQVTSRGLVGRRPSKLTGAAAQLFTERDVNGNPLWEKEGEVYIWTIQGMANWPNVFDLIQNADKRGIEIVAVASEPTDDGRIQVAARPKPDARPREQVGPIYLVRSYIVPPMGPDLAQISQMLQSEGYRFVTTSQIGNRNHVLAERIPSSPTPPGAEVDRREGPQPPTTSGVRPAQMPVSTPEPTTLRADRLQMQTAGGQATIRVENGQVVVTSSDPKKLKEVESLVRQLAASGKVQVESGQITVAAPDAQQLNAIEKALRQVVASRAPRANEDAAGVAEWEKLVAQVPRLEAVAVQQVWEKLGLKVVLTSDEDHRRFFGDAAPREERYLKIVGGILPDGLPVPSILIVFQSPQFTRDGGRLPPDAKLTLSDYEGLFQFIEPMGPATVRCRALGPDKQQYVFNTQAPQPLDFAAEPTQRNSFVAARPDGPKPSPFPSLDDQKLADLAYKVLGLELEPIGEDDLKRVKAHGFEGGLKVTATRGPGLEGSILVGLHVWSTKNMQDVALVLKRADLAELSPLKFYVINRGDSLQTGRMNVDADAAQVYSVLEQSRTAGPDGYTDSPAPLPGSNPYMQPPTLFTPAEPTTPAVAAQVQPPPTPAPGLALSNVGAPGTLMPGTSVVELHSAPTPGHPAPSKPAELIEPKLESESAQPSWSDRLPMWTGGRGESATAGAQPQASTARPRSSLRFEGKRFDEWRDAWRTELSAEKRLEAVKALAAFGANGYGKEAAEAILEVVKLYDWSSSPDDTPVNKLKNEANAAFGGKTDGSPSIPWQDWLPVLTTEARTGNKRVAQFAEGVFNIFRARVAYPENEDLIPHLLELSRDNALELSRERIVFMLGKFYDQGAKDDRITERLIEVLKDKDSRVARLAVGTLYPVTDAGGRGAGRGGRGGGGLAGFQGGRRGRGARGATQFELPPTAEYRPELAALLTSDDPQVVARVLLILQALGPKAKPALPQILPVILNSVELEGPVFGDILSVRSAVQAITGSDKAIDEYLDQVIAKGEPARDVERARLLRQLFQEERELEATQGAGERGRVSRNDGLQQLLPGGGGGRGGRGGTPNEGPAPDTSPPADGNAVSGR